jgi:hypothetical protein
MRGGWRGLILCSVVATLGLPGVGANRDDVEYRNLVDRVKSGDLSIDFRQLRLACLKSSLCEPRGTKADLGAMSEAEEKHHVLEEIQIGNKLLDKGYANVEVHATLAAAYQQIGDTPKAKLHLDVVTALLRSILRSGDGNTKETAFEVICDREEYVTLVALGLPYLGSGATSFKAIRDGGHSYERWEVVSPKTGEKRVVFFNVDNFSATKSRVGDK